MNAIYINLKQYPAPLSLNPLCHNMISTVVKLASIEPSLLESEFKLIPKVVGCKEEAISFCMPNETAHITDEKGSFSDIEASIFLGSDLPSNSISSVTTLADSGVLNITDTLNSMSQEIKGIIKFIGCLCDFGEGEKEEVWINYGSMIKSHGYSIGSMHLLDITKLKIIGITLPGHIDRYCFLFTF
jgi:hypothetical protein